MVEVASTDDWSHGRGRARRPRAWPRPATPCCSRRRRVDGHVPRLRRPRRRVRRRRARRSARAAAGDVDQPTRPAAATAPAVRLPPRSAVSGSTATLAPARPPADVVLPAPRRAPALLLALGLVMVLSASSVEALPASPATRSPSSASSCCGRAIGVPAAWVASPHVGAVVPAGWRIPLLVVAFVAAVPGARARRRRQRQRQPELDRLRRTVPDAAVRVRQAGAGAVGRRPAGPQVPAAAPVAAPAGAAGAGGRRDARRWSWPATTWAPTWCWSSIVLAVLFVVGAPGRLFAAAGRRDGRSRSRCCRSPRRTGWTGSASWLNPDSDYLGAGWQAVHGGLRARQRRLVGSRPGRRAGRSGAACRRRTPTSSSPSSARSSA